MVGSCGQRKPEPAAVGGNTCVITPELKGLIVLDTLRVMPVNLELELTGNVDYNRDNIFNYQSLVSGVVQRIHFKMGDYVRQGQELLEIKTTELSGQKSELLKARTELKLAERKLASVQNLYDDGVASDRDLQEAKSEVASARAEIDRIDETLTLQGGNIEKGLLTVRSPLSGYVVEKNITTGTQIDAGEDDLFVISDLGKIWVMVNVYAAQLERVQVGQQADIRTSAYPNRTFRGKIDRMSNTFDPEERVLKAVIEIDNKELLLKPSMMVSVNIHQPSERRAVGIPKNAVLFVDNGYHVVLYRSDCDVVAVRIEPVGSDKDYYYVDNGLIRDNDLIITKNNLLVYNKLKEGR